MYWEDREQEAIATLEAEGYTVRHDYGDVLVNGQRFCRGTWDTMLTWHPLTMLDEVEQRLGEVS